MEITTVKIDAIDNFLTNQNAGTTRGRVVKLHVHILTIDVSACHSSQNWITYLLSNFKWKSSKDDKKFSKISQKHCKVAGKDTAILTYIRHKDIGHKVKNEPRILDFFLKWIFFSVSMTYPAKSHLCLPSVNIYFDLLSFNTV